MVLYCLVTGVYLFIYSLFFGNVEQRHVRAASFTASGCPAMYRQKPTIGGWLHTYVNVAKSFGDINTVS
jgi:hypothetical protein